MIYYLASGLVGLAIGLICVAVDAYQRSKVDPYKGYLSGVTGWKARPPRDATRRLSSGRTAVYTEHGWRALEPPKGDR